MDFRKWIESKELGRSFTAPRRSYPNFTLKPGIIHCWFIFQFQFQSSSFRLKLGSSPTFKMVLSFQFLFLVGALVTTAGSGSGGSTSGQMKALCSASKQCKKAYEAHCTQQTTTPGGGATPAAVTDSTLAPLCRVIESRLGGAEDITESEQEKRIALRSNRNDQMSQIDDCDVLTGQDFADHIQNIIDHLDRAINYLSQLKEITYSYPVVATRTIQAQTALYLEHVDETRFRNPSTLLQLRNLATKSKKTSFELEKRFERKWNNVDEMVRATYFLKSPKWGSWKDADILDSKDMYPVPEFENVKGSHYDHSQSSECFIEMIKDCGLSRECAGFLLDPSNNRSTLIHNAMFFRMAIKLDCVKEVDVLDKFPNSDWVSVMEDHCSKMWNEANIIAMADFPIGFRSVFLEHGAISAYLGYPNFLRVDWMNEIMKWMESSAIGCIPPDTKDGAGRRESDGDDIAENGEWCSYYETSLGMQMLTLHLRYVLEKQQQCLI